MVFEREIDLEDFNEAAKAHHDAGVERHCGPVLSDGSTVIGVSVGPFIFPIIILHFHLSHINKDFFSPYLWVSVNIHQEILRKQ